MYVHDRTAVSDNVSDSHTLASVNARACEHTRSSIAAVASRPLQSSQPSECACPPGRVNSTAKRSVIGFQVGKAHHSEANGIS
jgi:hypothetical protein